MGRFSQDRILSGPGTPFGQALDGYIWHDSVGGSPRQVQLRREPPLHRQPINSVAEFGANSADKGDGVLLVELCDQCRGGCVRDQGDGARHQHSPTVATACLRRDTTGPTTNAAATSVSWSVQEVLRAARSPAQGSPPLPPRRGPIMWSSPARSTRARTQRGRHE